MQQSGCAPQPTVCSRDRGGDFIKAGNSGPDTLRGCSAYVSTYAALGIDTGCLQIPDSPQTGPKHPLADTLSRLPVDGTPIHVPVPADTILTMQYLITASDIRRETTRDNVLSQVFIRTREAFPHHEDDECLKPYFQRRDELSIHGGCLM